MAKVRDGENSGFKNKTGGFSMNDARSKSKGVTIRPALPSLRRTGTNGIRELTDIYVPRGSLNAAATDRNNGLHTIRVSCVRSDEGGTLTRERHSKRRDGPRRSSSSYAVGAVAYI